MGVRPDIVVEGGGLDAPRPRRRRGGWFVQILRESRQAKVGLFVLLAFVVIALIAPWIEPYSVHQRSGEVFCHPSSHHLLGCDDGGIDMVSLLIQGGRISLVVGFAATLIAMIIGGGIGIFAGY